MTSLIPFKCWIPWALKKHRDPELAASFIYGNIRNGLDVGGAVKPRQVKPRSGTAELSLVVIDGLEPAGIQQTGESIRKRDPKPVVGWAQISPSRLREHDGLSALRFKVDYRPIARHGNLVGWPTDKEKQLALAQALAMAAVGVTCDALPTSD